MDALMLAIVFIFGTITGSFLNVLIYRYHTGVNGSLFWGRSMCLSCGTKLTFFELVPVLSFVFQKGKCRTCKAAISWQYPAVELIAGALFTLIFYAYSLPLLSAGAPLFIIALLTLYYWVVIALFIFIAVYDVRHKIIPNAFVYALSIITLAYLLTLYSTNIISLGVIFSNALAALILALPFAAIWFFSGGRWMGLGDAKLTLAIGLMLGLSHGAAAVLLAIWIGALVGITLLVTPRICGLFGHKKVFTMKSELPFGPFLILGAITVLLTGWNIFSMLTWFT